MRPRRDEPLPQAVRARWMVVPLTLLLGVGVLTAPVAYGHKSPDVAIGVACVVLGVVWALVAAARTHASWLAGGEPVVPTTFYERRVEPHLGIVLAVFWLPVVVLVLGRGAGMNMVPVLYPVTVALLSRGAGRVEPVREPSADDHPSVPFGAPRWILAGGSLLVAILALVRLATTSPDPIGSLLTAAGSSCVALSLWWGWRHEQVVTERELLARRDPDEDPES